MKESDALFNTVDRLYLGWFSVLSIAVASRQAHLPEWPAYLVLHGVILLAIILVARVAHSRRGRQVGVVPRIAVWLHDWYPLALFIVAFEEVAQLSFLFTDHWQDMYLLGFEARLFPVPPTVWLARHSSHWLTEVLNIGYFGYFALLMIVGGALYGRDEDKRPFRQVMTASVLGYLLCYVVFLLFPTEGPAHTLARVQPQISPGGPFHWAVLLIQRVAGVHGNAFPSSHVAAGMVALIFAWRYRPKLGAALTPIVILLCAGATYDGYHYLSDVVAGAAVGSVSAWLVLLPKQIPAGLARFCREMAYHLPNVSPQHGKY